MVKRLRYGELAQIRRDHDSWGRQTPAVDLPYAAQQFKMTREARRRAKETGMSTQISMVLPSEIFESDRIPEYRKGIGFNHQDFDCLVTAKQSPDDWMGQVWLGKDDDFLTVRQQPWGRQVICHQSSNVFTVSGYVDKRMQAALEALASSIPYVR